MEPVIVVLVIMGKAFGMVHMHLQSELMKEQVTGVVKEKVPVQLSNKYYKKLYPYTALSIRLDSLLYPYMDKVKVDKTILDKEYKTLNELFSEFKGQTLFIDLWATWCMPCRSEMRMEILKPLDVELEKRNIRKLYLSVDDNERDSLWKRSIDVLKLSGYHHRVGKKLYKDIQRQVYGKEQFSVPRYLLWGKDGQLLSIDLPRPSTGKKLLDEIDRLLNY